MHRRAFLTSGLVIGGGLLAPTLTACTAGSDAAVTPSSAPSTEPGVSVPGSGRVLLAYFSRAGENYCNGGRIDLAVGNTQVVAELIAEASSVDVYRIEAAEPYSDDYNETVLRNVQEEIGNARPAIANPLPDVAGYDTVLLGSPVWNVQTPMIMRTFVEGVDLSGKTIHPFVTYAVSGIGRVVGDYTRLCPRSTIAESLAVRGEEAAQSGPVVAAWLRRIGL